MAQAVIGALRVNLSANTAAFSQGMKNAEGGLKRFSNNAKIAAAAIAGVLTAAVGGLALAMRGVINEADRMGKMAQSIGVPVDELSRLKHAADLSGVSLEQLSTSVGRLSRNMNDMAQGAGGEAARAFEQLGIEVRNVDGTLKTSSQVMAEVADRFSRMEDGAEKTALAMQLFGRAGRDMIPMLNQGAAGLNAMMREADELGIVIDQRTAKAAEAFNDNLTRLRRVFDGIVTKLTAEMLPALQNFSTIVVDAAKNSDTLKSAASGLIEVFKFVAIVAADVVTAIRQVSAELSGLAEAARALGRGDFSGAWDAFIAGQRRSLEIFRDMEGFRDRIFNLDATPAQRIGQAFEDAEPPIEKVASELENVGGGLKRAGSAAKEFSATARPALAEVSRAGQQVSSSLQMSFSSMFDSAVDGTFKLRDAIGNLLKDLARLMANRAFMSLIGGGFGGGGGLLGGLFGGLQGFQRGGSFTVGGSGGIDSQVVAFKATPGERVDIRRPGQDMGGHLRISVDVDNSGNIIPVVRDVAGNVVASAAPHIAGAAVRQVDRSLPGMMANRQARTM